jgi:hypothetical protein
MPGVRAVLHSSAIVEVSFRKINLLNRTCNIHRPWESGELTRESMTRVGGRSRPFAMVNFGDLAEFWISTILGIGDA